MNRRDLNLEKKENTDDSEYLREKRGTPHFSIDLVPSDPLLQGARVSSRSSSELSSSKGVLLVRKWKENERKWERIRKERKMEPSVSLLPKVKSTITVFAWALNTASKTIQITKMNKSS